jgi:MATE family multidrug resistance protein
MGSTDTVMCGLVSNDAQAAVGIGSAIYFLFIVLGLGVYFGITSLVSIADGAGKRDKTWKYIRTGLVLSIPISIALGVLLFLSSYFFDYLNQPEAVSQMTKSYLIALIWGTPFFLVFTLYSSYLNGLGKTWPPMIITAIALVLNYFFNDWLIFGKMGMPAYGFIGSAFATNLSKVVLCMLLVLYAHTSKELELIRNNTSTSNWKVTSQRILTIGLPIGFQLFLEVFAFTVSFIIAGWLGNMSLTAHQIVLNMASVTFMFITGISTSSNIMIGNGYGAKDKNHIYESAKACALLILGVEIIFVLAFILFPKTLISIYTNDAQLIGFAVPLMVMAAAFQVSDGFQNLGLNMLRGIKDVRIPALIAFVSYWLVMIPASYWLAMPNGFNIGVIGVWWGFVIGLSLASLILIYRFSQQLKTIETRW